MKPIIVRGDDWRIPPVGDELGVCMEASELTTERTSTSPAVSPQRLAYGMTGRAEHTTSAQHTQITTGDGGMRDIPV